MRCPLCSELHTITPADRAEGDELDAVLCAHAREEIRATTAGEFRLHAAARTDVLTERLTPGARLARAHRASRRERAEVSQ